MKKNLNTFGRLAMAVGAGVLAAAEYTKTAEAGEPKMFDSVVEVTDENGKEILISVADYNRKYTHDGQPISDNKPQTVFPGPSAPSTPPAPVQETAPATVSDPHKYAVKVFTGTRSMDGGSFFITKGTNISNIAYVSRGLASGELKDEDVQPLIKISSLQYVIRSELLNNIQKARKDNPALTDTQAQELVIAQSKAYEIYLIDEAQRKHAEEKARQEVAAMAATRPATPSSSSGTYYNAAPSGSRQTYAQPTYSSSSGYLPVPESSGGYGYYNPENRDRYSRQYNEYDGAMGLD